MINRNQLSPEATVDSRHNYGGCHLTLTANKNMINIEGAQTGAQQNGQFQPVATALPTELSPADLAVLHDALRRLENKTIEPTDYAEIRKSLSDRYSKELIRETIDRFKKDERKRSWEKYGLISMVDLSKEKIDTSQYLLGEGMLERGGGGFIVAPSGIGKTSTAVQAGFLWSVGKPAFDIKPYKGKPLKVILVQAENPRNKLIRNSWMWLHLGFTAAEAQTCQQNFHKLSCNDVCDENFINMLEELCEDTKPDLLLIDPFNSYMAGSPSDEEAVKEFLRIKLNPVLTKCGIGCLIVHHTPKTNNTDTSDYRDVDFSYRMSGSAELTNWARCVLAIETTNTRGVCAFRVSKAYDESGWDEQVKYWAHTSVKLDGGYAKYWSPAKKEQINKVKGIARNPQEILKHLGEAPLATEVVISRAKLDGWNEGEVKDALRACSSVPDITFGDPVQPTVFKVLLRTPTQKPRVGWQTVPGNEDVAAAILEHIPNDGGIKPDALKSTAFKKSGYVGQEVDQGIKDLEARSEVKLYSGEGSTQAATYIIRTSYEIEWLARYPKSTPKGSK